MGSWFKQFETLIWAASVACGVAMWAYTSFATKEYVNMKHESAMEVMRDTSENVKNMRQDVKELNRLVYELARKK